MKTILSLALGIVLAGPVAAYANESPYGQAYSQRTVHRWFHRDDTAFAAPSHVRRHQRDPFKPRTTNGLSRNPDACASYGCVDVGSQ